MAMQWLVRETEDLGRLSLTRHCIHVSTSYSLSSLYSIIGTECTDTVTDPICANLNKFKSTRVNLNVYLCQFESSWANIQQLARIAGRSCGEVLETIHFLMLPLSLLSLNRILNFRKIHSWRYWLCMLDYYVHAAIYYENWKTTSTSRLPFLY